MGRHSNTVGYLDLNRNDNSRQANHDGPVELPNATQRLKIRPIAPSFMRSLFLLGSGQYGDALVYKVTFQMHGDHQAKDCS